MGCLSKSLHHLRCRSDACANACVLVKQRKYVLADRTTARSGHNAKVSRQYIPMVISNSFRPSMGVCRRDISWGYFRP